MNRLMLFSERLQPQTGVESKPLDAPVSDVKKKDSQLLNYIYSVNPVTGLPQGDLSVYLGDKANPQVRAFIEMNLLQETENSKSGFQLPDEVLNKFREHISDDDIAAFSRNHGETKEEYADRMKLYMLQEKQKRSKQIYEARLKKLIEETNE